MFDKLNPYQLFLKYKFRKPFLKSLGECKENQEELLFDIIKKNRKTIYGKEHNFNKINSIEDFKKYNKIQKYENLKKYIKQIKAGKKNILTKDEVCFLAITSGTTNEPKYLPHTKEYILKRKKAWNIWIESLYEDRPKTFSIFGKILTITAKPFDGYTQGNTKYGSISGQVHDMQLPIIKFAYSVPDEIFLIEDYKLKYYLCILFTIKSNVTLMVTPNPSTLILFARQFNKYYHNIISDLNLNTIKMLEDNSKIDNKLKTKILKKFKSKYVNKNLAINLKKIKYENKKILPKYIFKNLQTIGCWMGGNVGIYVKDLKKYYGDNITIRDIGYMASEGRFSIPIKESKTGEGVLDIKSNFYEFIEVENYDNGIKETILANQLELNKKYFIIITNENGLYRYFMDDIIKVESFEKNTPSIKFLQKGKYVSSISGEKVTEWQIIKTMKSLHKRLEINFTTFFVYANLKGKTPTYEFHIRFTKPNHKKDILNYEKYLDEYLSKINIEYKDKRDSKRLNSIKIIELNKGSLNKLKRGFTKNKNDSQVKVPKLIVLDKDIDILKGLEFI